MWPRSVIARLTQLVARVAFAWVASIVAFSLVRYLFTPGESIKGTDHEIVSSGDVPRLPPGNVDTTVHPSSEASAEWMRCAAIPGADVADSSPGSEAAS